MAGKPITDVLNMIRGGVFTNEASDLLAQLVERVQDSGKKGKITITLELNPSGAGNRIMTITPKCEVKLPPRPETQEAAIFFVERGALLRDDPTQRKLPLEERREARDAARDGGSPAEVAAAANA